MRSSKKGRMGSTNGPRKRHGKLLRVGEVPRRGAHSRETRCSAARVTPDLVCGKGSRFLDLPQSVWAAHQETQTREIWIGDRVQSAGCRLQGSGLSPDSQPGLEIRAELIDPLVHEPHHLVCGESGGLPCLGLFGPPIKRST